MSNQKNMNGATQNNVPAGKGHKTLTIIGIVLCVILIPLLIINCTLIIKSYINKDEVPDFGGVMPLIVLTDSMYPDIKSGDIIVSKTVDANEVNVGDVISFFDPAGNGQSVVTHKVIDKYDVDGKLFFKTKGINNNTEDSLPVPADKLVGKYTDVRIPLAGHVAIFMQTVPGLIVCVILPILIFVGYDILRRRKYDKVQSNDVAALMAELEALKAAQAQNAAATDVQNDIEQDIADTPDNDAEIKED